MILLPTSGGLVIALETVKGRWWWGRANGAASNGTPEHHGSQAALAGEEADSGTLGTSLQTSQTQTAVSRSATFPNGVC